MKPVHFIRLTILFTSLLMTVSLALAVSETSAFSHIAPDPKILEGRWEGKSKLLGFLSYYGLEIFAVDTNRNRVYYRELCTDCGPGRARLFEGKERLVFEIKQRSGSRKVRRFELRGDKLLGTDVGKKLDDFSRHHYSLQRRTREKLSSEPKKLVGTWEWVIGRKWWQLDITEVDPENKTFKGKYTIGQGKNKGEHELSNETLIIDGEKLIIAFVTHRDRLHYRLTFFPNFEEYPPVLWGTLEKANGRQLHPLFSKKTDQQAD